MGLSLPLKFLWRCSILPCCSSSSTFPTDEVEPEAKGDLDRFSWSEIESATSNFSPASIIGHGSSSSVYLAHLPSPTAIKVYHHTSFSHRLREAFTHELTALRIAHHPNIVPLIGFSEQHSLLILPFIPNGTLHDSLTANLLPWPHRISIALHLAHAIAHLHHVCHPPILHADITSSNVLLDTFNNPILCDFGSAQIGFSAAVRSAGVIVGSPGYADPAYLRTGLVSKKTDVYSYGVLLLEILTGMPAVGEEGRLLTCQVGPLLAATNWREMVDPRLRGVYDVAEVAAVVEVAAACIGEQPSLRPTMEEVVRVLREKVPSLIMTVDGKSKGEMVVGK